MKMAVPGRVSNWFSRRGFVRLTFSLAIVAGATLVRLPLRSTLGDASPFLFYWPAVVLVVVVFGMRLGLLAIAAAALQANFFWMAPHHALGVNRVEFLQLVTFCFGSSSLALLSEWLRREQRSKERFRATLANAGEAIITTDSEGRIAFVNPAAQLLTGMTSDEALGQVLGGALLLLHPSDHSALSTSLHRSLMSDTPWDLPDELLLVSRGGTRHPIKITITAMRDLQGGRTGAVIVLHRKAPLEQRSAAHTAPALTGAAPACSC